MMRAQTTER